MQSADDLDGYILSSSPASAESAEAGQHAIAKAREALDSRE